MSSRAFTNLVSRTTTGDRAAEFSRWAAAGIAEAGALSLSCEDFRSPNERRCTAKNDSPTSATIAALRRTTLYRHFSVRATRARALAQNVRAHMTAAVRPIESATITSCSMRSASGNRKANKRAAARNPTHMLRRSNRGDLANIFCSTRRI